MRRVRAAVTVGFVSVLVAMLAANLASLWENQQVRPYESSPTTLYAAARGRTVSSTFLVYYVIRRHLRGAHLTIPPELDQHTWFLERISRVRVSATSEDMIVPVRWARRSRARADHAMYVRVNGVPIELYFFFERSADRYVVARNPAGNALFVVPEAAYRSLTSTEP